MTPPFLVFIEGATGGTAALPALARAMAAQYGMPVDDLLARLQHGRVRVRTTPDAAFAESTRRELEAIGARCVVTDSTGVVIARPPDTSAVTAIASRAAVSMPSGLAAASRTASQDLGAISSGALSLAALDGSDDDAPRPAPHGGNAFAPPPPPTGTDAFAPPDEQAELDVALDIAEAPRRSAQVPAVAVARTQTPVAVARTQTPLPPPVTPASVGGVARAGGGGLRAWLGEPLNRFVLGVVLCLGLAFVPAHIIGRVRERPALAAIDAALVERQAQVLTTEDWRGLDRTRATFLARKEETRRDLALTTMLIWFAVAGGLGYVWFRKLDWDALTA